MFQIEMGDEQIITGKPKLRLSVERRRATNERNVRVQLYISRCWRVQNVVLGYLLELQSNFDIVYYTSILEFQHIRFIKSPEDIACNPNSDLIDALTIITLFHL